MNGKIYMLTNNINGMKYIGQTTEEVNVRISRGYGSATRIGTAIEIHGLGNFTLQTLETGITTQIDLNRRENYYIQHYGTLSLLRGYNERLA